MKEFAKEQFEQALLHDALWTKNPERSQAGLQLLQKIENDEITRPSEAMTEMKKIYAMPNKHPNPFWRSLWNKIWG